MTDLYDPHTEYRRCHQGGAVYLAVEGVLWLLSASLGAAGQIPVAMLILLFGGMFSHPIAIACSRLLGLPSPDKSNRLSVLNTWIALTIPLGLLLIFMATAGGHSNLFFPAFAALVGAHWLLFAYIYSMNSFLAIAGFLVLAGILLLFAAIHLFVVRQESLSKS